MLLALVDKRDSFETPQEVTVLKIKILKIIIKKLKKSKGWPSVV